VVASGKEALPFSHGGLFLPYDVSDGLGTLSIAAFFIPCVRRGLAAAL
jgi:hypothetical protein